MQTLLIAEGDDRVGDLFADLFALEGWTVAPTIPASARSTRSLAALLTTRHL